MFNAFLAAATPVVVTYLAGTGALTNAALVAQGVVRAGRHLAAGQPGQAAVEVLGAATAPAVLAFHATGALVEEVVAAGGDLVGGLVVRSALAQAPGEPVTSN